MALYELRTYTLRVGTMVEGGEMRVWSTKTRTAALSVRTRWRPGTHWRPCPCVPGLAGHHPLAVSRPDESTSLLAAPTGIRIGQSGGLAGISPWRYSTKPRLRPTWCGFAAAVHGRRLIARSLRPFGGCGVQGRNTLSEQGASRRMINETRMVLRSLNCLCVARRGNGSSSGAYAFGIVRRRSQALWTIGAPQLLAEKHPSRTTGSFELLLLVLDYQMPEPWRDGCRLAADRAPPLITGV
jgi:hypothetical protein